MDYSTEDALKKRMGSFTRDKTMILVTHRTSLMDLVDRLIVIDRGVVVADGKKAHVLDLLRAGKVGRG